MNIALIILGVVLIVVGYVLYTYLMGNVSVVNKSTHLMNQNPEVPLSKLGALSTSRYAYSTWLYVQAPQQQISDKQLPDKYIFNVGNVYLYVDRDSTLTMFVGKVGDYTTYKLMDNFPLQKWMYVVISFDNKLCDIYINGKLLSSIKVEKLPIIDVKTDAIKFTIVDVYIANFQMLTKPMDPATAWSNYLSGNGAYSFKKMFSSYGINMELTKDSIRQSVVTVI